MKEWLSNVAKFIAWLSGGLGILIAALGYVKGVRDSYENTYYEIVQELGAFPDVDSRNADRAVALISRLRSEYLSPSFPVSTIVFPIDEDRSFQAAYALMPFARAFGDGIDKVGIIAGSALSYAIPNIDDVIHRDILISDFGSHLDNISSDFPNERYLAPLYLSTMYDVQCHLALLSKRVGRAAPTDEHMTRCVTRLSTPDPLDDS